MTYKEFLENKIDIAPLSGIEIDPSEINPVLKPHQRLVGLARGPPGYLCPVWPWQDRDATRMVQPAPKARGWANLDRDAAERHA